MKKLMLLLLFFGQFSFAIAQETPAAELLEPETFDQEMQREGVLLIDVRTPEEFEEGHLEGALNIDYTSEDFLEKVRKLDRDQPVLLYCRSGNRSGKAALLLSENGFESITDLKGGYLSWEEYQKLKK